MSFARWWSSPASPSTSSRVFNDADIRPETLLAIGPRIAPSVALILPGLEMTREARAGR